MPISDEAGQEEDQIGFLDESTRAIFGRSYAAEPDVLIEQLRKDEAIAEADTLLLTIPNQLGVAYNVHVMEAILTTRRSGPRLALNQPHILCAQDLCKLLANSELPELRWVILT